MANFYDDNDDLRFYIEQYLDWEPLVRMTEYQYQAADGFTNAQEAKEFYLSVLELIGDFCANEVAPLAADNDRNHPTLVDGVVTLAPAQQALFDQMRDMALHGMTVPRELGGMNMPFCLFLMCNELFSRADVSVNTHFGFHGGMAMAALLYSIIEGTTEYDRASHAITRTRFADVIEEIITGQAWGSMDITEPGAGSDMAALRTRGTLGDDGIWRVSGEKIFITSGHARYHFVIARTEVTDDSDAFAGLQGLSMFLVKTYDDAPDGTRTHHATFAKLEDKLGHHGSATVAIHFDDTPAQLIGQRGDGFKLMLFLMNNARIGVGFEALGVAEACHRLALAYAAERESMGKTLDRHEMIADYLQQMRTEIQAVRAMTVQGAYHEEMNQKLDLMLRFEPPADEDERRDMERQLKHHRAASRRLTPLIKYLGAESTVRTARRTLQIHGGFGYSTEYAAERLLRDAMVLPIYEGTSQIQALMAMKDTLLGVMKDPKRFVENNARARWRARSARDADERRVARLQVRQYQTIQYLIARLAGAKWSETRNQPPARWLEVFKQWDPRRDFAPAMLHAERLCQMLCDVAVAELLLKQTRRFPERREVMQRHLEAAEPRSRYLHDQITTTGARLLQQLAGDKADDADTATG